MTRGTHVLYRFYNSRDELLYVGITSNPMTRFRAHQSDKSWWPEVATINVENYASRRELLAAERAAIKAEHPRYNTTHNRALDAEARLLARSHSLEAVAAAGLAPSVRWLQEQIRANRFPAHQVRRGHWVMTESDVDALLSLTATSQRRRIA